ncbi:MAG: efflux RND transporter permease subunit [Fimbriimonas sp.]
MNLTTTALTRPVFIFVLVILAFFGGTIGYQSMRKELNPEVNFGVVTVSTVYPGAGPEEINNLVSRKIEEAVSGVNGLKEVTATSREGISTVIIQFELGQNIDVALNDVRTKVDGISGNLPRDTNKPVISKFDNAAAAVLTLAITSDRLSSQALRELVDEKISDKFGQISGVSSASAVGGDVREIQVQVKKDKLLAYGIGIADVQRAVQAASLDAPAGRLLSGDQEFSVRVLNQFEKVEDIQNMVFTVSNPREMFGKAKTVRLSDVATVTDTVRERTQYSRLNGQDVITLAIQKTRDGNAVEISNRAKVVIGEVLKEYKDQGIKVTKTFDQATQISESLFDLNFALFFGIFLVGVIVFVFLHNMRGTIIVSLAIPTSIFATFVALKLGGFTINNLSLLALSLAVGVLVDDAIVVLENIYRHLKMGEDPREAAMNGRAEIGLAAIAITLADVVVFLPIAFMGGITGQFFRPLALGYVFAVLFSLFISFTLTPLLAARWYRRGEDMEHPTGRFAMWFERAFGRLEHAYRVALEWALNHRWFVFILGNLSLVAIIMVIVGSFRPSLEEAMKAGLTLTGVAVVVGLIAVICNGIFFRRFKPQLIVYGLLFGLLFPVSGALGYQWRQWKGEDIFKFSFFPSSDGGQVNIKIELAPGTNLETTDAVVRKVEAIVLKNPEVKYATATLGSQGAGGGFGGSAPSSGSQFAAITATLYDKAALLDSLPGTHHEERLRYRSSDSVASDLVLAIGRIAGANINVSAADSFGFGAPIQMSFRSDDRVLLQKTVTEIKARLQSGAIPGVINVDTSSKPGKPELRIRGDRVSIADAGTTPAEIGSVVRTLYQGNNDTKLRYLGKEYDVRVMLDRTDRDNPSLLQTVPIKFVQGNPVYLGSLGTIVEEPGIDKIDRRAREEEIQITADLLPGNAAGSVQALISAYLAKEKLVPEGVKLKPLGQADSQASESQFLFGAIITGLLLVYLLLASLYDNWLYPFIIQISQPQAIVGALLALMITDKALNLVGFIGIVSLIGLVGKNAILVVDYTNTLRARGRNRHDALVEAGPTRLRPIMMTTVALVLGVLPVALAIGRGSEFRETIGITIIGGITLSTLLTLLVIPCSYTIFDDLSNGLSRILGKQPSFPEAESTGVDDSTELIPS